MSQSGTAGGTPKDFGAISKVTPPLPQRQHLVFFDALYYIRSMKNSIRLNLGSVLIDRDDWEYLRKRGYTREDIRQLIVQNGEESLMSYINCGDLDDAESDD